MFLRFVLCALVIAGGGICVYAQNPTSTANTDVKRFDTPIKILSKPSAAYPTSETGTICMQGSVRLKVTFLSTGDIGGITPVTRLPFGATENAIAAAKKMKFIPAMKDGKAVTITATVDYSFTIY